MLLTQLITKIVPFTHAKHNDSLVETDRKEQCYKYLFLNLALRSEHCIEKMKAMKCIYDLQDSIMFIFCQRDYSDWFTDYMQETLKFKEGEPDQVCQSAHSDP